MACGESYRSKKGILALTPYLKFTCIAVACVSHMVVR